MHKISPGCKNASLREEAGLARIPSNLGGTDRKLGNLKLGELPTVPILPPSQEERL